MEFQYATSIILEQLVLAAQPSSPFLLALFQRKTYAPSAKNTHFKFPNSFTIQYLRTTLASAYPLP